MLNVKFSDGELITNANWASLENKPIKYISYKIYTKTIKIMGFEKYLALKEIEYDVNELFQMKGYIILIGISESKCTKIIINLKTTEVTKELVSALEIVSDSWKTGEIGEVPIISETVSYE